MRRTLVSGVVLGLAFTGCDPGADPSSDASPGQDPAEVRLTFDEGTAEAGDPVRSLVNGGHAAVEITVVGDGLARRVRGRVPWAVRLPAYDGSTTAPRAVIGVRITGDDDLLEPAGVRLRFGADFRLNAVTSGTAIDNGDNLIQRGLSGDPAQFKIQTDGRRAVCSVKGSQGRATVRVPTDVVPGDWYRAVCVRDGTSVRLRLLHWRDGSWRRTVRSVTQATGDLDFARRTPLSVGGKLTADGDLASSTDQFNGVVDNAFLDIG